MRKALILLALTVLLVGCTSMGQPKETWTAKVEESYGDGLVKIDVVGLEHGGSLFGGFGIVGVSLLIGNESSKPAVIAWSKSAIEYNSGSYQVFLSGQKFMDAGRDVPDRVIGAGSRISIGVYPADNVYYADGWKMKPIKTSRLSCLIYVKVEGEERYYTLHVDITPVQ